MNTYSLSHLSDHTLLRDLAALVARDRATTAELLAHIAEVDDRRLYLPAAYPSMYAYCVHELHLSEDCAYKRIQAARTARRFPAVFAAVAEGRLHLSAVVMLAPYLTTATADELLAAAGHKSKAEIEHLLAQRFPRPDLPTRIEVLPASTSSTPFAEQLAPGRVGTSLIGPPAPEPAEQLAPGRVGTSLSGPAAPGPAEQLAPGRVGMSLVGPAAPGPAEQLAPGRVGMSLSGPAAPGPAEQLAPGRVDMSVPRSKLLPLAPGRIALQLTLDQEAHDMLRHAQTLLSHRIPSGDLVQVLKHVLAAAIPTLEKRKFAAASKPRSNPRAVEATEPRSYPRSYPGSRRETSSARHIPAHVKRAVWARDQGRCTFTSDKGQRCPARRFLEFDHVDEVARGGRASIALIRLRCRAHNQYTAEQTFGAEFMRHKREQARAAARATSAASGRRGERVLPAVREPAAPVPIQRSPAPHSPAECTPIEHLPIEHVPSPHMPVESVRVFADPKSRPTAQDRDVVPWLRRHGFSAAEARRMATRCDELLPDTPLEERIRAALARTCA